VFGCLFGVILIAALWWLTGQLPGEIDGWSPAKGPLTISEQLGIDALEQQLGDQTPTGRGIVATHVESRIKGAYLPPLHASRFHGVTFLPRSGPSQDSGHAAATATIIYGPKGLAPGIAQVNCYATEDWLSRGFLRLNSAQPPQIAWPARLISCSWISDELQPAADALLRVDQVVDQQGVVMVVAVNNGKDTPVPPILSGAYNVISVGNWDGDSSGGYTTGPEPGRCKPDLVAPGGLTSFATPAVAALAARLLEHADTLGIERAIQPMAIKAVLMAGADKPVDWHASPEHPLDEHDGAGRPRLDHSDEILIHPLKANHIPGLVGWDHREIEPGQSLGYRLKLIQPAASLSVVLLWQRRVTSTLTADPFDHQLRLRFSGAIADMNLKLLKTGQDKVSTIAQSISKLDNVEHIYARGLPEGQYDLIVTRPDSLNTEWDYVIAWRAVIASPTTSPLEDVH
jgi:hypothetical protein